MAKELPYFKFEPSEWLEGEIQICSDTAIVCFMNLCSGYWIKLGSISYAFALHKYFRKDAIVLKELIDLEIIKVIDDNIVISFLDIQLQEFNEISIKRSEASKKRWEKNTETELFNANAMQLYNKSNAIREDKTKEDKKRTKEKTKKEKIEGFLKWFNLEKQKHTGKLGRYKMLSKTDVNNLFRLLESYNYDDFKIAIPKMFKNEWAKETNNQTPTHFLRNDNFNKYLNTEIKKEIIGLG